jgi:hypothetical protein
VKLYLKQKKKVNKNGWIQTRIEFIDRRTI